MSVTQTSATLLATAQSLATSAKAGGNVAADMDEANVILSRFLQRYDAEVAAALQVTVPSGKSNFAGVYGSLTSIVDGAVFTVSSSQDSSDTSLATAKGSAPAAGDTFQRSGTAPVFVGNATKRALVAAAVVY